MTVTATMTMDLELLVLRHELAILRRQTPRPVIRPIDRLFLTAASRLLARARWQAFFVTPATLLSMASSVDRECGTYPGRRGRRPILRDVRKLAVPLGAREPAVGGTSALSAN
jgi:putative transposase